MRLQEPNDPAPFMGRLPVNSPSLSPSFHSSEQHFTSSHPPSHPGFLLLWVPSSGGFSSLVSSIGLFLGLLLISSQHLYTEQERTIS